VLIRLATTADYERLGAVLDEAERFHRHGLPGIFRNRRGGFPSQEYFGEMVTTNGCAVFVADSEQELLGFVTVRVQRAPEEEIMIPRTFAMVDLLAVRSDRQHEGIGRELMEAAHAWARERKLAHINLSVWEFNQRAIGFYRALGYETVSRLMELPI
jgi:ribosomal protein S18 acetylase RimI-like enzyme